MRLKYCPRFIQEYCSPAENMVGVKISNVSVWVRVPSTRLFRLLFAKIILQDHSFQARFGEGGEKFSHIFQLVEVLC